MSIAEELQALDDDINDDLEDELEGSLDDENINEDENDSEESDDDEIEIVREVEGSQPEESDTPRQDGIRKRINKLNAKISQATEISDKTSAELEAEREKVRILELALQQRNGQQSKTPTLPNPSDFAEGVEDSEYIEAKNKYDDYIIESKVSERINQYVEKNSNETKQSQQAKELESRQTAHYERVAQLKIKNYEDVEDKAIEIFGNQVTNTIIQNFDDSEKLLYFFGKNPREAERMKDLLQSSIVRGVAELGALSKEIKLKRGKKSITPNPDEELSGRSSGRGENSMLKGATFE